jgi:hypothetical protein
MAIGYVTYPVATELAEQWCTGLPDLEADTQSVVGTVLDFATALRNLADAAVEQGRARPDLIAWWTGR